MLRVVTTNNAEIFRHFGAKPFQALGVEQSVGTDFDALLELVRTKHPQVAIVDVELPGRTGFELCKAIKSDPALASVHVTMALSSVVSRSELQEVRACGCDDVLALPLHTDDFHRHIAQVVGLPLRQYQRIPAGLGAHLEGGNGVRIDHIDDVSLGGLGVVLDGRIPIEHLVGIELEQGGRRYPELSARIAWTLQTADRTWRAGLRFESVPIETRMMLEELCLFDVREGDDGSLTIGLHGDLAEHTDLTRLGSRLLGADDIDFDMGEVRYMSSVGVRVWIEFLAGLAGKRYSFRRASMAFVSQVAMIPAAAGTGKIVSFEAPYRCATCDRDDTRLLETAALVREGDDVLPPTLHCGACRGELVFDDLPRRYLAFASG